MDLAPGRSFVEWAVQHGHQTFMISYRNPDDDMSRLDDGRLFATRAFWPRSTRCRTITGAPQVNVAALCLGGTMALIALAYLAAHGQGGSHRFGDARRTRWWISRMPGDLGVFTDEATISRLETRMAKRGYLESSGDGARRSTGCARNDLIWSYVVNNWFKGKQPPAFDILAWNGDSTRMPVEMHSQYLRSCYLHNSIVKPNAFVIDDTPIDLGKIRTPLYVLGRRERSHRAVARDVSDDAARRRRRRDVHADELRAHRRHRQPARQRQVVPLDQRAHGPRRERRRSGWRRRSASRGAGGTTGPSGRRCTGARWCRRTDCRPGSRRRAGTSATRARPAFALKVEASK